MKLIIKPEKGLGKIEVELSEEVWGGEIKRLSERYGVPPERVIEITLTSEFRKPRGGDLEELGGERLRNSKKKSGSWRRSTHRFASKPTG